MVQTRFKGRVTKCILQSGNIASSFVNMYWSDNPDRVVAQFVANTIPPVGWHQGHRQSKVAIDVHGEITEILGSGTPLVVVSGDNVVMTSCAVEFMNHLGSTMRIFVVSPVIDNIESKLEDFSDLNITRINMKAYYVTLPATA